jgi:hypothetical protein
VPLIVGNLQMLCGPMLRRVTSDSVSVFVAVNEPREVRLILTDPANSVSSWQGAAPTVALGAHLHVALVTVAIGAPGLDPGQLYEYDVRFVGDDGDDDEGGGEQTLASLGLLEGDHALGYDDDVLPHFSVPPVDPAQLNLVHGSCRKPHGEGADMLAALDDLLRHGQHADPLLRPHLLLLTGDQIYADDVAPPMLKMIHDTASALLGWHEELPGTAADSDVAQALAELAATGATTVEPVHGALGILLDGLGPMIGGLLSGDLLMARQLKAQLKDFRAAQADAPVAGSDDAVRAWAAQHSEILGNLRSDHHWGQIATPAADGTAGQEYVASRISPPQRAKELRQHARLTSDAMSSHLMFLGEFYAMYLLVWSDALWPRKAGTIDVPAAEEAVPNYGFFGELSRPELERARAGLTAFAESLPKVRRVLATIPTLMILDDHEVTDDWNLNADWVVSVNSSAVGPHLLRSALAAYAVFQDWGNQPEDYLPAEEPAAPPPPPGRRLLDALTVDIPDDGGVLAPPPLAALGDNGEETEAQQQISTLLGVGKPVAEAMADALTDAVTDMNTHLGNVLGADPIYVWAEEDPDAKVWSWSYQPTDIPSPLTSFRILALDTRTRRGFPTELWKVRFGLTVETVDVGGWVAAANLIHPDQLGPQLTDRLGPGLNVVISPAPVFGLPLVEDLIQRYKVLTEGPEVHDFEAWKANPDGYARLVAAIGGHRVVLLSGDVHHAYSNVLTHVSTDQSPTQSTSVDIAQLCSSSLKNETGLTRLLGRAGRTGQGGALFSVFTEGLTREDLTKIGLEIMQLPGDVAFWTEEGTAALGDAFSSLPDLLDTDTYGTWLSEFKTWFAETAPLLNPLNPASYTEYYLKLKDASLLQHDGWTPLGVWSVGSGIGSYAFETLFLGGSEPVDQHRVTFLSDTRLIGPRMAVAAARNPETDEEPDSLETKLRQMPTIVGYNNLGLVSFSTSPTDGTPSGDVLRHELLWHTHDERAHPDKPLFLASTIHEHGGGQG